MITYNEKTNQIVLKTNKTMYIMQIVRNKYVAHLYYGKIIDNYDKLYKEKIISFAPYPEDEGNRFSLDTIQTELSFFGSGDLKKTAIKIKNNNGDSTTLFYFVKYEILKGEKEVKDLPYSFNGDETLKITYYDDVSKCFLYSYYTVFEDSDTISRHIEIQNKGDYQILINTLYPCQLDIKNGKYKMLTLDGEYYNERNIETSYLRVGVQSIYSKRGHSSHNHNPFLALAKSGTNENSGEVYGVDFVYSGDFDISVEKCFNNKIRILAGMNSDTFSWALDVDNIFYSPECIMTYSNNGLNGMTNHFHDHIRNHIISQKFQKMPRPILLNTWESMRFDINEEKILAYAKTAKEIGIETLVIDDGWFGVRNNDNSSLGDWYVNLQKFPDGIENFAKQIRQMGLKLGIWIEPEMINTNSALYLKHPDWILKCKSRKNSLSRNQLVLDLTNDEVVEYISESVINTLKKIQPDYIKWDFNRSLSEVGSNFLSEDKQCETSHRFMIGSYKLHKKITSAFPDTIFEGCAGGGGRFDTGILSYCPQIWASDNTDAISRLKIQKGTSMVYPISSIGSHVSDTLINKIEKQPDYNFRFHVTLGGMTGYEMDITKLSDTEKKIITNQIIHAKKLQPLLLSGDLFRLDNLYYNEYAFTIVSKDKSRFILSYSSISKRRHNILSLYGINEEFNYMDEKGEVYKGEYILKNGIMINTDINKKYTYTLKEFHKVD